MCWRCFWTELSGFFTSFLSHCRLQGKQTPWQIKRMTIIFYFSLEFVFCVWAFPSFPSPPSSSFHEKRNAENIYEEAPKSHQATMNNGKKLDAKALELNLFLMVILVLGVFCCCWLVVRVLFYLWKSKAAKEDPFK